MNKRFLAIAIAAGLAVSSNVMAEGAEIYGVAHASLDNVSADDGAGATEGWFVTSRNSRIGVKGSEDLGGGLKAVYKMEFGVDLTDAKGSTGSCTTEVDFPAADANTDGLVDGVATSCANGNFYSRNQYVGISGGMGTVLMGRHDTPTKMAQGKFDVFNDTAADMANNLVDGEVRADNVIAYLSPKMGGMQLIAALLPGEGATNGACDDGVGGSNCDGISDGMSVSFTYEAGPMYVGVAMDSGDILEDVMRLAATYNMDAMQFGFLYQARSDDRFADADLANDETAMGLSAKFGMNEGKSAVKAQYIAITDFEGVSGDDGDAITLGYDMNLSARTTAYALYNMFSPDASNSDVNTLSLGIAHNF